MASTKTAPMGRPKLKNGEGFTQKVQTNLTREAFAALATYAHDKGFSIVSALRFIIVQVLKDDGRLK